VRRTASTAIAAHVSSCSACTASLKQSQLLLGQLDATYHKEDQLRRLSARIDQESGWKNRQPPPVGRRMLNFSRQCVPGGVALDALGLSWLKPGGVERPDAKDSLVLATQETVRMAPEKLAPGGLPYR